jgi:Sulfotransferase domain
VTGHLLVIGAQRCGTTYLSRLLDAHPDITMARPARPEPKVFLSPELAARGLEWYRATYFAHATNESLLGDKSTSYIEHPEAAGRAASMLGTVEVVALLRDPVSRAVSNWSFSTDNGFEDRPLAQALTDNLADARTWDGVETSVSPYAYLERGRYADYLPAWMDAFPGRVHVRFMEELVGADAVLAGLYAAIGVDSEVRPACRKDQINSSTEEAPDLPPDLLARLRTYFAASDAALCDLLDRKLPWSVR